MMKTNEAQFLNFQNRGRLWRAQVVVATLVEPPHEPEFTVLFCTPWMRSPEAAELAVLPRYFAIYSERQGFKHPDDPTRTSLDRAPDCDVLVMRAA